MWGALAIPPPENAEDAMAGAASQIEDIRQELQQAREWAHRVAGQAGERWGVRPAPERWSVAECLIHLNATSTAFLSRIREALSVAHRDGLRGREPYRRDFWGWALCRMLEPPARMKMKTPRSFQPSGTQPPDKVLADFDRLQDLILQCVQGSEGLPLGRLKIPSPFAKGLKYSLYSAYRVVPAHQRRHLWQAEQALAAIPHAPRD